MNSRERRNREYFARIADKLRPISDIPNVEGFKLTLVAVPPQGQGMVHCEVRKDANGCHYCHSLGERGCYRNASAFSGWLPY